MKKTLFLTSIAILLIVVGLIFVNQEKKEKTVGGERDKYGCLGSAGYSYNREIGACARNWELDDGGKIKAATIAAADLTKSLDSYALTIIGVEVLKCPGCYQVSFDKEQKRYEVNISDWAVTEVNNNEEEISSFKECVEAGYPIMKSNPSQCQAGDQTFFEETGDLEEEFNESGRAKAITDETDMWMLYENDEAGFSLKYPQNITMEKEVGLEVLSVEVTKIDELEGTMGFNEVTALLNQESLANGEYGKDVDWPLEESKKIVKVGNTNGQDFLVLSRFEVCNVTFERKLYFFNNDYQVVVTLTGQKEAIINEDADYFKEDTLNCGEDKIWGTDQQINFYQKLSTGETRESSQQWYKDFDRLVATISFLGVVEDVNLIEGGWISETDQDFAIEFKDSIKMDYYGGEKMSEGSYEIIDGTLLKVTGSDEIMEYEIAELSADSLVLIYKDMGNELRFRRE